MLLIGQSQREARSKGAPSGNSIRVSLRVGAVSGGQVQRRWGNKVGIESGGGGVKDRYIAPWILFALK